MIEQTFTSITTPAAAQTAERPGGPPARRRGGPPKGPPGPEACENAAAGLRRQRGIVEPARRKRKRPKCSTLKLIEGVERQIMALGVRIAQRDVDGRPWIADDLQALLDLKKVIDLAADHAIDRMLESGWSDGAIGKLLGVSKQAVAQRRKRHAAAQEA